MIETLVGTTIALATAIAIYNLFDASNRSFVRENDLAAAQAAGRVAMETIAADLRMAGLNPNGIAVWPVPQGDAGRVRLLSDRDLDGTVGGAGEDDEEVCWSFVDVGSGLYELRRGVDLDGDWSFAGAGESEGVVATDVVPIDADRNGTVDPFLAYDVAPPAAPGAVAAYDPAAQATARVRVTYGIRAVHRNVLKRTFEVVSFRSEIARRSRFDDRP